MADDFTINNAPGGADGPVEVEPQSAAALVLLTLFARTQELHDTIVSVIEDLAEQGLLDADKYIMRPESADVALHE